jgi:hypothetical protein
LFKARRIVYHQFFPSLAVNEAVHLHVWGYLQEFCLNNWIVHRDNCSISHATFRNASFGLKINTCVETSAYFYET